jgi:hypothetical protein
MQVDEVHAVLRTHKLFKPFPLPLSGVQCPFSGSQVRHTPPTESELPTAGTFPPVVAHAVRLAELSTAGRGSADGDTTSIRPPELPVGGERYTQ